MHPECSYKQQQHENLDVQIDELKEMTILISSYKIQLDFF